MKTRRGRLRTPMIVLAALSLLLAACADPGADPAQPEAGAPAEARELPPCPLEALETATEPVEVVVWHSLVARTEETLQALIDRYNSEQTRVRVRLESQGSSYQELWNKYQQAAQAGDLPAMAILEDTNTQAVIDSGTVLPAQSCIDASGYDTSDLVPTAIDFYSKDGVLYPGTVNLSTPLLYFNANHFRRAGLDPAAAPTTLAELRSAAQAIRDAGVAETPIILNLESWFIETWLTGEGQSVVDNDNGRGDGVTSASTFDNPVTSEVLTWMREMVDDGLLEALPNTPGAINHYLAMANQQASMTFATSTAATSVEAFLAGDTGIAAEGGADVAGVDLTTLDIDAAAFPGVSAPGRVQVGGGAWFITNTTPDAVQAAAWDFVTWWNRPEIQVIWHMEGSYIPFSIQAADDPAVVASWEDDLSGRWLAISYRQLTEGVDPAFPGPLIGPYDEFRQALEDGLDRISLEGADPAAVAAEVQATTTEALTAYNEEGF